MNRQKILVGYIVFTCVCFILTNSIYSGAESDKETGLLTTSAEASEDGNWEDSQWIFYVSQCSSEQQLTITLNYTGNLNLDLVIFVDESTAGDKVLAWDITHCGWDENVYQKKGYSAIDTKDTASTGLETVVYINLNAETKTVYILVYAADGVGDSKYTLTCSNAVNTIPVSSMERCWTIIQAWALFGIGSIIFSVLFLKIVKRSIMTPDQKAAEKLKKEEIKKQKEKKAKASGKAPSSMAARKSSR